MKNREEIITAMCHTYRHDYGLTRGDDDPPWVAGMTQSERDGLRRTMAQILDNDIIPYMDFKNDKPSV